MTNNPFESPLKNTGATTGVNAGMAVRKKVPGGIVAVAIICLILGGLNSFFGCCGIGMMAMGPQIAGMVEQNNPDQAKAIAQPKMDPVEIAISVAVILAAFGIVIGSILTLTGKNSGRHLLSWALLFAALAGGTQIVLMLINGTGDIAMEMQNNPQIADMPADQRKIAETAAYAMFYFMAAISCVAVIFYLFAWRYVGAEKHRPHFN